GADERRHDQGRGVRLRADRVRPAGAAGLVVEHGRARARRRHRRDGRALCVDAARSQAPARLSYGREPRHHLHRPRPVTGLQPALRSPQLPSWGLKLLVPAVGALLALSAALAAACFVKAFGVTFLGRPRTGVVERAHETDRWSLSAMFFFAALCLVAGILPGA